MMSTQYHFSPSHTRRGAVLVFVMILMTIALMAALGIVGSTVNNQRASQATDQSTTAFQAADTGAERVLYNFRRDLRARRLAGQRVTLSNIPNSSCRNGIVTLNDVFDGAQVTARFADESGNAVGCTDDAMVVRSAQTTGYYKQAVRAVAFSVSVPPEDLVSDLVAHWPFDSNYDDVTSGGNDATPYGGVSRTSTAVRGGRAASFNGSSAYLTVDPDSDVSLDRDSNYTISLWVRADVLNKRQWVFGSDGKEDEVYNLQFNNRRARYSGLDAGLRNRKQWYHMALVQDADNGVRTVFVNGVQENDGTSGLVGGVDGSTRLPLSFGAMDLGGVRGRFFDGIIDDVRIYTRVLSASEIILLCKNDFDGTETTPAGVTCGE